MDFVSASLTQARRLLADRPAEARLQAQAVLRVSPGHPEARLILAGALRRVGDLGQAREVLETLAGDHPRLAQAHYELGLVLSAVGEMEAAKAAFDRAAQLNPLMGAAIALNKGRLADAEPPLRERLSHAPNDVAAMRMLADLKARLERYGEAQALLERCLRQAPTFLAARYELTLVLLRQGKGVEALAEADHLLRADPVSPAYRDLRASALMRTGDIEAATAIYETLTRDLAEAAGVWLSYGHALKTLGRTAEAIFAYRRAAEIDPDCGEAYGGLANLKTYRFTPAERVALQTLDARDDLDETARAHLGFALGKALEDEGRFAESFAHYSRANQLRRRRIVYDAQQMTAYVDRCRALFTRDFFAQRAGWGASDADPIFIVGLPRSGSTLVEQILASHSAVEATQELAEIGLLLPQLRALTGKTEAARYPEILTALNAEMCEALGQRYIARTRIFRKTDRPFFIDKLPNNFEHIALIHLILPNARIIDVRRHPLSTCLSCYKQNFALGQNFSYELIEIAHYYCDYLSLTSHFDVALQNKVHRIIYEDIIENTDAEIDRLLKSCGLSFEASCLRFWETSRAVKTASSEQVRRPIFRTGLDSWRPYQPWLGALETALGPVLDAWR